MIAEASPTNTRRAVRLLAGQLHLGADLHVSHIASGTGVVMWIIACPVFDSLNVVYGRAGRTIAGCLGEKTQVVAKRCEDSSELNSDTL